ncbi:hypothetical protein ACIA49_38745 [Kribbella sp. NPDC051587]|uniref:hypothetical protein n=1 Tax=Kribbella sp. NPDC051587 TaxID=3364119 RepID=UPI0037B2B6BB
MAIEVRHTAGGVVLGWTKKDDPRGWVARLVDSDVLADALTAVADEQRAGGRADSRSETRRLAASTAYLARLLERREQYLIVQLRDEHNLSWAEIASTLYDDPSKRSSARRKYEVGHRLLAGTDFIGGPRNGSAGIPGPRDDA